LKKSGAKNFFDSGAGILQRPWPSFKSLFASFSSEKEALPWFLDSA